jgi:hypothetical protein
MREPARTDATIESNAQSRSQTTSGGQISAYDNRICRVEVDLGLCSHKFDRLLALCLDDLAHDRG